MKHLKKYSACPTIKRFHQSNKEIRLLAGSVGNGKTTGVLWELFLRALSQGPDESGTRYTRAVIVRNHYSELEAIVVEELRKWWPPGLIKVKISMPIKMEIKIKHPSGDGTIVDSRWFGWGMDSERVVGKIRSTNYTFALLNEADLLPFEVFDMVHQRVSRTPENLSWGGVLLDYNPPSQKHWITKRFVNDVFRNRHGEPISEAFHMPPPIYRIEGEIKGGFFYNGFSYFQNPKAEGIDHQPKGIDYWFDLINGKEDRYIRRFILGEYVGDQQGVPVYPAFNRNDHIAPSVLKPVRQTEILFSFDWDRHTACTISQVDPMGYLLFTHALYAGDIGLDAFLKEIVKPVLVEELKGFEIRAIGDPSGRRSGLSNRIPFEVVEDFFAECGYSVVCEKAVTNDWASRKAAVNYCLGKKAGLVISRDCTEVISAFSGDYAYKKGTDKSKPVKNEASHMMNCVEYACLDYKFLGEITPAISRPKKRKVRKFFDRR